MTETPMHVLLLPGRNEHQSIMRGGPYPDYNFWSYGVSGEEDAMAPNFLASMFHAKAEGNKQNFASRHAACGRS